MVGGQEIRVCLDHEVMPPGVGVFALQATADVSQALVRHAILAGGAGFVE